MSGHIPNEYDIQAQHFLTVHGLAMTFNHAAAKMPPWQSGEVLPPRHYGEGSRYRRDDVTVDQHWRVTIRRKAGDGRRSLTFDFFNSIHDTQSGINLRPYSVLACISSDVHYTDVDELISELGMDADSRRDHAQARAAVRFAERLRTFFSEAEIEALQEIR
jgi:hypothetical protein